MRYVLHDTASKRRYIYAIDNFREAFKAFVLYSRVKDSTCALWCETEEDVWTRLYATENYPPKLSQPWC